ncbi:enhancer of polycomb homolog 1-like [Brachionichthys hirsutus]|uniref:enhancer of polycomb homolog 1-like n=1 Tax=Brachionichthys hirsutus TaxID=412623 RepID=UPI003604CC33
MSKLSFRARALDASKPLPVFRCEDLPDLHEYASINRAVPQMPTGMEKEEESEHHLQRAISAQQVYGEKRDNMVIPVPEAERNITHYESLYPGEFKMPKQLIHIQREELLHLTLEVVEKRNTMPDLGSEVMAEALAQRALMRPVYTIPIIPLSNSNQYRHQDHSDMKDYKKPEKAEAVRTKRKYEKKPKTPPLSAPQHSGPSVFNPKDLNQYDFPSSDEEPFSQIHSGSSEAEEENDPDGCYGFRRKAGCHYYASRPDRSGSWPWVRPSEGGRGEPRFRYCLTSLNTPRCCIGLARRRLGRGGRILLDRAHAGLDSDAAPEPLPNSPLRNSNASTSVTDTSHSTSSSPDLGRILLDIKSCRWRHFRPRTLSHHLPGGGGVSRRGFRDFSRTASGINRTLSGGAQSRTGPAPPPVIAFTAEQYQQHQEQLVQMQRRQLEQSQQQQQAGKAQALASKTLDQASAQFAASALVTTDQLLTFKSKEESVLSSGVNGVLAGAGVFKGLHPANQLPHAANAIPAPTPGILGCSAPASTQVLIGNNICLSVPSAGSLAGRHIPRTLGNVPASALKLSAANNLQMPKVSGAPSMDLGSRDNHDEDKPALSSLADNTVAMEVT